MWISLLTLLLLLVTPISCRAEIRQEHGTRFRILLRIWGIPLRFDHSQAPLRPTPPRPPSSFKKARRCCAPCPNSSAPCAC